MIGLVNDDTSLSAIFVAACAILEDEYTVSSLVLSIVFGALGSATYLCVLGSRMLFNLKEAAEHGVNVGTNWSSHWQTTMRFDGPATEDEVYVSRTFHPVELFH